MSKYPESKYPEARGWDRFIGLALRRERKEPRHDSLPTEPSGYGESIDSRYRNWADDLRKGWDY